MLPAAHLDSALALRLARELEQVGVRFERQLASELSAVNRLCVHVERFRGKMLRPTLVLLSGLATAESPGADAPLTDAHRIVAAVVEMIHMATLVHDDVLDEADVRRRGPTLNHLWGNEAAVMLGDYLISNAFHLCSTAGDPAINLALGAVTNTLCEGELAQLHHRNDLGLDEATYFEIVRRKTASLIAASCELGARLSGASEADAQRLHSAGESLGIAFQIQDDLLDLVGAADVVGKSLGKDLEKGKLTLPVILHLSRAEHDERGRTLRAIEDRDATALGTMLRESGSIDTARRVAHDFVDQARSHLTELPESGVRGLLLALADAVVQRDR